MNELKPIGGFFELELSSSGPGYHPNALALTNGRACMRLILEHEKPSRVYLPFYSCYALFEPIKEMGIEYVFYKIDNVLDPVKLPTPRKGELLVFINYYGLKNKTSLNLDQQLGKQVIIDDTHNFFHQGYQSAYSFTSARKYFGVPDGAYLYGIPEIKENIERNVDVSIAHNVKRLLGKHCEAYRDYSSYEDSLGNKLKRISLLSEQLLSGINYETVANRRINNFGFLHDRLHPYNTFPIDIESLSIPFCYPFLPEHYLEKKLFHLHNFYIPTLWPDILERKINGFEIEKDITRRLLPLPVDHRYLKADMERMINFIVEKIQ